MTPRRQKWPAGAAVAELMSGTLIEIVEPTQWACVYLRALHETEVRLCDVSAVRPLTRLARGLLELAKERAA